METSHLRSEILEQPEVLEQLLDEERGPIERVAHLIREYDPRFVVIVARGSSDNAARYGQYLFGAANGLAVALATPSLFTLYERPPRLQDALVLAISQSGQSPDIVAVVEEGQRQGALTVALTNDDRSPLARAAGHTIRLHAGRERSVAATKTYTASLGALAMLSAVLDPGDGRMERLHALPERMADVLRSTPDVLRATERYRYMEACVVISRGFNYATSFEIALKLKELTYVLAEPYSSADFQHGPVALVEQGFPVLAVVPEGEVAGEMVELLQQLREREAELVVISAREDALALAQTPLPIPGGVEEALSPPVTVIPGQLFALGLTRAKGFNPDHPRGLRKVTRTH
jgi:glucosamine--fructose-6-phosphate aminotransferase (isomerizing)